MNKKILGILSLLGVAIIFGASYSIATLAGNYLDPLNIVASRFLIGAIVLSFSLFIKDDYDNKLLFKISLINGVLMLSPTLLVQMSVSSGTPTGKAGFITSLYIIFVPFISYIIYRTKLNKKSFISLIIALIGLILICNINIKDLEIIPSDIYVIGAAVLFAIQMILLEKYANNINTLKLNCLSLFVASILGFVFISFNRSINLNGIKDAFIYILLLGVFASALGYILQTYGQKIIDSTTAALIMSLESVMSCIAGFIILNQTLSIKELIGSLIMFIAIVYCQIPDKNN